MAGSASAQGIGKSEQGQREQQHTAPIYEDRSTGALLTCAQADPDQNGTYRCKPARKPSVGQRLWRWAFRAGRDPIAVFTFALLCVGVWQVGIAQRTARRQLRAYVFADNALIGDGTQAQPHGQQPGVPRTLILIKNSGQTPAHDVRHWGCIEVRRLTEEGTLTVPKDLGGGSVSTIPTGGINTKILFWGRQPTPHEISEIQTGVSAVYVFGRIEYRDIYGKLRGTNYRLRYSGAWPPAPETTLTFCEHGNDAN